MFAALLLILPIQLVDTPDTPATPRANPPRAAALDPSGALAAIAWEDGEVRLYDAASGEEERRLEPRFEAPPWTAAFSPDGARLAVLDKDGVLRVWALESGDATTPLDALPAREGVMRGYPFGALLRWSPDGRAVAVADSRCHGSLWSAKGEARGRWEGSKPPGDPQLAWLPDSSGLLTAEFDRVVLRDAATGEPIQGEGGPRAVDCRDEVVALALHPAGELFATGHDDGRWRLWELATGELVHAGRYDEDTFPDPTDEVAALAFSPGGERLALSTREGTTVIVLDVESGEPRWVSEFQGAHFFEAMELAWSPDGARLWFAFACQGGVLKSVAPGTDAAPSSHGDGGVPTFGGELALVIGDGAVRALGPDGAQLWRRDAPEPR